MNKVTVVSEKKYPLINKLDNLRIKQHYKKLFFSRLKFGNKSRSLR